MHKYLTDTAKWGWVTIILVVSCMLLTNYFDPSGTFWPFQFVFSFCYFFVFMGIVAVIFWLLDQRK